MKLKFIYIFLLFFVFYNFSVAQQEYNFAFDDKYIIKQFSIMCAECFTKPKSLNYLITAEQRCVIQQTAPGRIVGFNNIKVQYPDGSIKHIDDLIFELYFKNE